MILEYLFLDKSNKAEIETHDYKEEIDTKNSVSKKLNLSFSITEFKETDNWAVRFEINGENENNARFFSKINKYIMSFSPIVLQNDCSAYFNRSLYPLVNQFERLLRKYLYIKSISYTGQKLEKTISDLEKKDFGEIYELLFVDKDFCKQVKNQTSNPNYSKLQIQRKIDEISENTVWNTVVGIDKLTEIKENFIDIKDFRNDVMHAHNISYEDYKNQQKMFKNVNMILSNEIEKMIKYPVTKENSETVIDTISERLQNVIDNTMRAGETAMKLIELGKKLSSIEIKPEYKEILEKLLLAYGEIPISNIEAEKT